MNKLPIAVLIRSTPLKLLLGIAAVLILGTSLRGAFSEHVIKSRSLMGFFLTVQWVSADNYLPADQPFEVVFHRGDSNGPPVHLLRPTDEFFADLRLESENGLEIEKTRKGKEYGAKFYLVEKRPTARELEKDSRGRARLYSADGGSVNIPKLSDLFDIPGKGRYSLTLRAQVYKHINSTNETWGDVLRFEPMRVPVAGE